MRFPYKNQLRQFWNERLFPCDGTGETGSECPWTPRQRVVAWTTLIAVSLLVLASNLSYPLIEPDETRYAQIAIEMIQSRDWVTPTLGGKAYLDKPPLMYWVTAISFRLFGVNETAARLPAMFSAFCTAPWG